MIDNEFYEKLLISGMSDFVKKIWKEAYNHGCKDTAAKLYYTSKEYFDNGRCLNEKVHC